MDTLLVLDDRRDRTRCVRRWARIDRFNTDYHSEAGLELSQTVPSY
jgi:hypothetical protein